MAKPDYSNYKWENRALGAMLNGLENRGTGRPELPESSQDEVALKKKLKDGDPKGLEHLFEMETTALLTTKVERVIKQDNNIVGMIPSGS